MAQVNCLTPDCKHVERGPLEVAKRRMIEHINQEHAEGHVIIACDHRLKTVKEYADPQRFGGVRQRESVCERCGNRVIADAEPEDGAPGEAGPALAVPARVEG